MPEAKTGPHGSRPGREHTSLRQHLLEDHPDIDRARVRSMGEEDVRLYGMHDGVHNCTWAEQYDLPHSGDSPFRRYTDPALASRVGRSKRSGP